MGTALGMGFPQMRSLAREPGKVGEQTQQILHGKDVSPGRPRLHSRAGPVTNGDATRDVQMSPNDNAARKGPLRCFLVSDTIEGCGSLGAQGQHGDAGEPVDEWTLTTCKGQGPNVQKR